MGPPVIQLKDLPEIIAQIEARLVALEASLPRVAALEADVTRVEKEQPTSVELGRLKWFVKHGRRRPW